MNRIHFDNMKNWRWITVLILSLVLIIVGSFELFEFENPIINKGLTASGFFLQVIFYSRFIWHKNYFQWNKKGTYIRINSWIGKSMSFDQIESSELNDNDLIITKKNGKKFTIHLDDIVKSDVQKLNEIIEKNTIKHPVYY